MEPITYIVPPAAIIRTSFILTSEQTELLQKAAEHNNHVLAVVTELGGGKLGLVRLEEVDDMKVVDRDLTKAHVLAGAFNQQGDAKSTSQIMLMILEEASPRAIKIFKHYVEHGSFMDYSDSKPKNGGSAK